MQKKFTHSLCFLFSVMCLFVTHHLSAQTEKVSALIKQYALQHKDKLKISEKEVESLFVTFNYIEKSSGVQHIYATQKLNGLTITSSNFSLHSFDNISTDASRLILFKNYKALPISVSVNSRAAVSNVMNAVGYSFNTAIELKHVASGSDQYTVYKRNNSSIWDIPCRLVYYNDERLKTLIPAWEIQMMDAFKRHYWLVYINALDGKVLEKKDLIIHCDFGGGFTDATEAQRRLLALSVEEKSAEIDNINEGAESQNSIEALPSNKYRVYNIPFENPIDPGATHALVTKGGDTLASPDGWHKVDNTLVYNYTHGNNVWAFKDPSPTPEGGIPSADPTRTAYPTNKIAGIYPLTEPFVFDYPIDLSKQPQTYQNATIVNLFFWNNLMHDVSYYFGFDEAAGNFQESNTFSTGTKGGITALGGDEVLAQAQDGGGTNNANFLTLPDGVGGEMQMYLWTASFPDSLVQFTSSTSGTPMANSKYIAVIGSFSTLPTANTNLYTNPVVNKKYAIAAANALSTIGTPSEGCSTGQQSIALPLQNVSGKIAVIDRGDCSFVEKVLGAQLGGAAGVVIVNNVDGPPLAMGGTDAPGNAIIIPSVMISKTDGDVLKAQLTAGAVITGSLKANKPPAPERDGDIDNGVMCHEYTHGISNRLTGGGSLLPLGGDEQGGEGWSDFVSLYMTLRNNDLTSATGTHPFGALPNRSIGNYVTYQTYNGPGIREYQYSTNKVKNPATFAYIKRPDYSETHSVGFVWCTMLYELLQSFIDEYGMNDNVYEGADPTSDHNPPATAKGNNIAVRLVIEGMKLQPINPTFVQERDAILAADTLLYNGQHSCMIWKAFAKRGLGFSAISGTNALGDETEAFDVPLSCNPTQKRIKIVKSGPGKVNNNSNIKYSIAVSNLYANVISKITVSDTLASSLSFVSATFSPTVNGKIITWSFKLQPNQTKVISITAKLSSTKVSTAIFSDDQESGSGKWSPQAAVVKWKYTTDSAQAYSGLHYWFVPDQGVGGENTSLQTANKITVTAGAELVFIHKYAAESGYDGGVVEISENGTTWTYLPPTSFVQNGYPGIIPTANNPYIGLTDESAFTGVSDGYVVSIASLADYIGKSIYIRFRMTADATGGNVTGGGWWLDDVYVLTNRTQLSNKATAITTNGAPVLLTQGVNAYSSTSSFIIGTSTALNSIATKIDGDFNAQLYPNPTKDVANILVNNRSGSAVNINLYDVLGNKLAVFNAGEVKNKTISLPVKQLPAGTYWITVKTVSDSRTIQLVIQK